MEAPATAILEQLTAVMSSLERSVNLRLSRIERMLEDQGRRLVELGGDARGRAVGCHRVSYGMTV